MFKKLFNLNSLSTFLLYLSILIFIIAFNFSDNPTGGWQQQFMPDLNGASITDITFVDSLTGFAVTSRSSGNSYILKTTNGGDNWNINFTHGVSFVTIQFVDFNIGFTNAFQKIFKTTNSGLNWNAINLPGDLFGDDMFVLNEDTIWLAQSLGGFGGLFRTTNGGINWTQQFSGNPNPEKVYMFNKDIGFISAGSNLLKTTNSGISWILIPGAGGFLDIYFADSLTGWKTFLEKNDSHMQKTTNGGLNWQDQVIPNNANFVFSQIGRFSNVNNDTIWGVGGNYIINGVVRGVIFKTTNGGNTWGFQIPDTSINIYVYSFDQFINKNTGWCYSSIRTGVHTSTGGDSVTLYTGIKSINTEIVHDFELYQNYPNPFNPKTIINYELRITNYVEIRIYNVSGIEVKVLVKEKQNSGNYTIQFDGSGLSSGIYFYSLFIDGERVDTKKMVLVR